MKYELLRNVGVTGAGQALDIDQIDASESQSFQAAVTGTGAVAATVVVEVSNDPDLLGWVTLGTITLSGTTTNTDGFVSDAAWQFVRGNITAISGTGALVALVMGA